MGEYNDTHRAFVQALLLRPTLSVSTAISLVSAIFTAAGSVPPPTPLRPANPSAR